MSPLQAPTLFLLALLARGPAPAPQAAADEQYRFLAGLVDKGMHELAVEEARKFLAAYPKHEKAPLARYRLAGALWELERQGEAEREYDALARLARFEYRAESLFRCGEAAALRGDEARAQAAYEAVLAAGQDYLVAPAMFALGETHFRAKRYDEAEARYTELLRVQPSCDEAPLARRALAWCAFERGDKAETARRAREYLGDESDPARRDELRLLLGEALLVSDARAALEAFRALETREQAEASLRGQGFAQAALGDHAAAAQAFEKLLERAPEGRFAREAALQAGIERLRGGDARGAVARLTRAAEDGSPETLYWMAQAEKQDGAPDKALKTLERARRARPEPELEARIQVLRGDCLAAAGRPAEARAAYEQSGSASALHAGAVAALNAGDAAGALALAESALRAEPEGPRAQGARVVVAEALFAGKDYAKAERALEAARKGSKDPAEELRLASRLAWCRYLSGDLAAARARFADLAERGGNAPEGEEALGMLVRITVEERAVAKDAGKADENGAEARAAAERYLQRFPTGRFADQALLALARAGEGPAVRHGLEQWLKRFPESPERAGVLLELAELELAAGGSKNAARRYAEVRTLAPGTPSAARADYGLAWCAWEQHDWAGCVRALAPLVTPEARAGELAPAALELQVSAQVEQGELEAAVASWRALAALGGDEQRRLASARRVLAGLRSQKRFDDARALLAECQRSLTTRALAAEAQLEGAYLALEEADPDAAEAALARARKAGAGAASLAEASYHVGEARLAAGDAARAASLFEGASGTDHARTADALYKLGFVRLAAGDLDGARAALARLLEQHGKSELAPEARFLLGECAFRARDFEEAVRLLTESRPEAKGELGPKVLFRLGLALGELERWSECEAALTELARTAPQFPNLAESELWRGRALLAQEKARPARAAFERTLSLDQGELAAAARLGLASLAEREGRTEDALSEYLKVALLYQSDTAVPEALFSAGRLLEARGESAKAAARYEELGAQYPKSPFAGRARERLRALGSPEER